MGGLVETEAADVGGLDDVGVVVALLGESDRVVLNAVGSAEFIRYLMKFLRCSMW